MNLRGQRGQYQADESGRREGGQAIVLPATDLAGERWAVRIAKGGNWLAREAALLRKLDAGDVEWIVRVVDEGTDPAGRPFVVSPWYPTDLTDWLDQPGRTLAQRLAALELACAAIARLHRAPDDLAAVLVHRDVKPSNFLVREGAQGLVVVLADLGIAKEGVLLDTTQNTGAFTPRYSPPEQQLPLDFPPDPSIDVYGLGVTCFAGLVLREPHSAFALATAWTPVANRLVTLHHAGARRSPAEDEEYKALRRRPLRDLVEIDDVPPLLPADEAALRQVVTDDGTDPDLVLLRLLPVLKRALEPDPARRLGDARQLVAACRAAREALGDTSSLRHRRATQRAPGDGGSPTLAPAPSPVRRPPADTFAPASLAEAPSPAGDGLDGGPRWARVVLGALVAGGGLATLALCLGMGGAMGAGWTGSCAGGAPGSPDVATLETPPVTTPVGPATAAQATTTDVATQVGSSSTAQPVASGEAAAPRRDSAAKKSTPPAESPAPAPSEPEPVASPAAPAPEVAQPLVVPSLVLDCPKPLTVDGLAVSRGQALPLVAGSHKVVVTAELAQSWTVRVVEDEGAWSVSASDGRTRAEQRVASGGRAVFACDFEGGLAR